MPCMWRWPTRRSGSALRRLRQSYLSIEAILDAARQAKATMVHPGYGFLSERARFAQDVTDAGLTFVGPSASAIETMGDKAAARRAADAAGMPIVPGTPEPVDLRSAKRQAERIGFPLLVKAAFGGGGKGMHVVRDAAHLEEALKRAAREAQSYFGRPEVFLERYVDHAHHVEAQIIGDTHGNLVFLGERDCSVQRRHQKLIEETPSSVIDDATRTRLAEASISLAREAGYVNAGTVECIVDEDGDFYFLEMNTRLQVEHTVTEMVTGLDIVALQLEVAMGGTLDIEPHAQGHAIQCRINAEDPGRNFLPGPGRITRYREPAGPFVRVDSGVGEGREVPGDYDSMFAKLIVSAPDRESARRRMLRALDEYVVEGVPTTIPVQRWILDSKEFRVGHAHHHVARARVGRRRSARPGRTPARRTGAARGPARRHPRGGGRSPRARSHLRRTARCRPESSGSPRGSRRGPHPRRDPRADAGHDREGPRREGPGDPRGRGRLHPRGHEDGEPHPVDARR